MDNQSLLPSPFIKEDAPIKYWHQIRVGDWIIHNDGRVLQVTDTYWHNFMYTDERDITHFFAGTLWCIHPPTKETVFVRKDDMFGFYIKKNKTH